MKVYIELVVLDNLILTSAIAGLAYAAMGMRVHKRRTAVCAVTGTLLSVFYPFWQLSTPLLVLAKIAIGILLGLILFARLRKPALGVLLFFGITVAVGGLCVFVSYLAVGDISDALLGAPVLPYCVPAAIGGATFFLGRQIVRTAKKRRIEAAYTYCVKVALGDKCASLKGYLDSGNRLYDEKSGLPIVVIKLSSLTRVFGRREVIARICGSKTAQSVGNMNTKLFLIKPDEFILYSAGKVNKYNDVMLGVTETEFSRKEDMLLHPSVIGG